MMLVKTSLCAPTPNLVIIEPLDIVMVRNIQDDRTVLRDSKKGNKLELIAIRYDWLLEQTHRNTGINKSVLYAYFVIEATNRKGETDLFAKYGNPGGIKFTGRNGLVKMKDDCGRKPCKFDSIKSEQIVTEWSRVFNMPRYSKCKKLDVKKTCKCLQDNGYHTSNSYLMRSKIATSYEKLIPSSTMKAIRK